MVVFVDSSGKAYPASQVRFGNKLFVVQVSAGKAYVEVSGRPEKTLPVTRYSTAIHNRTVTVTRTRWKTRTVTGVPMTVTRTPWDTVYATVGEVTQVCPVPKHGGSTVTKDVSATRTVTRHISVENPTDESMCRTRTRTVTEVLP